VGGRDILKSTNELGPGFRIGPIIMLPRIGPRFPRIGPRFCRIGLVGLAEVLRTIPGM